MKRSVQIREANVSAVIITNRVQNLQWITKKAIHKNIYEVYLDKFYKFKPSFTSLWHLCSIIIVIQRLYSVCVSKCIEVVINIRSLSEKNRNAFFVTFTVNDKKQVFLFLFFTPYIREKATLMPWVLFVAYIEKYR
jgi:hypothetical protein